MKIQFIGTGSIAAVCNSASVLINDHILFDVPNGSLKSMIRQGIDILKIDTIIISHTHADHCFDLPFVLWYKENFAKGKEKLSTTIITDDDTKNTVEALITLSHFNSANDAKKEFIDLKRIRDIDIFNNLDITAEKMDHVGIRYANGYIIKDKNIRIGLTGDTSLCEGVIKLASNVDYLIADMTLESGNDSHMGINNILEIIKKYPKLKIVPIHMHDKTREKIKKLDVKNIIIVEDSDILEL